MNGTHRRDVLARVAEALRSGGIKLVVTKARRVWHNKTYVSRRNFTITLARRCTRRPVIHAIGDSHTFVLQGVSPFVTTWLGGATAFGLSRWGSTTGSRDKLEKALRRVNKQRDIVLLIVGEIDCRIHVYNQYMKNARQVPMERIIDETIERYGNVVASLAKRGYRVVVHSVPATAREDNLYGFPFYADEPTRAWIVSEFNKRLAAWCRTSSIEFLDIYCRVADETGFIAPELTEDLVHLGPAALPIYHEWAVGLDELPRPC